MIRLRGLLKWGGLAFLMAVTYATAAATNLFEWLYMVSRRNEIWQLDEVFGFLLLFGFVMPLTLGYWNLMLRRSLTQQRRAEAQAHHVSRHDSLTGLYNRLAFCEALKARIAEALDGGPCLSVILFDLDRFKPINDLRGHDAGDRVLCEVAQRLQEACKQGQMPARLGGDEFAVILKETGEFDHAARLATRILTTLEKPLEFDEWSASISASIGIAVWEPCLDPEKLMRAADQAMYRAKRDGRGKFAHFDAALGERLRKEAEFETALTQAIETGAIVPHFQPILDMTNRRITGFEVLARWSHPTLGQISPERFIPVAEQTGQIAAVSAQILRQACVAASAWDPSLTISVNLSPRQFNDRNLPKTIEAVLRETKFPPSRLEIEITETALIDDLDHARETIETLRWLGIRLSLDDFGTGFSSLATLSKLPFDRLKIDRSFIAEIAEDTQRARIVSGIVLLAGSLNVSVVAEGIETEEEFEALAGLNCELGQGFLFEQALPVEEVARLLSGTRENSAGAWGLGGSRAEPGSTGSAA